METLEEEKAKIKELLKINKYLSFEDTKRIVIRESTQKRL